MSEHEIGTSPPRGRPRKSREDAEQQLSEAVGRPIELPDNAVVTGGPQTCPACGSNKVKWGCSDFNERSREEIHPVVWHETAWMADSFLCMACDAGWIEPDEPVPITWVRPWWLPESA